jgi:hypothetical protein
VPNVWGEGPVKNHGEPRKDAVNSVNYGARSTSEKQKEKGEGLARLGETAREEGVDGLTGKRDVSEVRRVGSLRCPCAGSILMNQPSLSLRHWQVLFSFGLCRWCSCIPVDLGILIRKVSH